MRCPGPNISAKLRGPAKGVAFLTVYVEQSCFLCDIADIVKYIGRCSYFYGRLRKASLCVCS